MLPPNTASETATTPADGPGPSLETRAVRTVDDLTDRLASAAAGDTLTYYRGFLCIDRTIGSRLGDPDRIELDQMASAAMALAHSGRVHLLQRRHGFGDYSYVLVASRKGWSSARRSLLRETAS